MNIFFSNYSLSFLIILGLLVGCSNDSKRVWNDEGSYRWAQLPNSFWGTTGFSQLDPSSTNIHFKNVAAQGDIENNRNYLNGSGVAAADVDGDGLVDLYFGQLNGPNKLYKNIGNLEFEDITEQSGLAMAGYNTTGVVFADVDGDGDPDLLQTSLNQRNELLINNGEGVFELHENSGLGESKGSNTMALADVDGDSDLDLYISNYKVKTVRDIYSAEELAFENTLKKEGDSLVILPPFDEYYGIIETDGRSYMNEYGERDELYLNNGDGTFNRVEDTEDRFLDFEGNPVGLSRDWGLTARFQDLNNDHRPDLYVTNDFWTPDRIWINQGEGRFKGIDRLAIRNMSFSSMGVDFSDIDRDGYIDIFVTEMLSSNYRRRSRQLADHLDPIDGRPQYNRNSMYHNRGDGTFSEIAYHANLEASEWSWATKFLDIDFDGYEDMMITTGNGNDYQDMDTQIMRQKQDQMGSRAVGDITRYPVLELANKMFWNQGNGTFSEKSSSWGFTEEDISLGLAVADLDNDGDPDAIMNRLNRVASIYENTSNAPRIAVRLKGQPPNTSGVGSKITLKGGPVQQAKEMVAGGDYVSSSQPEVWFAATEDEDHQLMIEWPSGGISTVKNVKANRIYEIDEPADKEEHIQPQTTPGSKMLFEDVSGRINHSHHEDPYNDFNVQDLLPRKLSRQGPGVSWIDYDRDGDDDLLISSGKGGELSLFENDGTGDFNSRDVGGLTGLAPGDQTTVIGWSNSNGTQVLVGSSNFEQGDPNVPSAYKYSVDKSRVTDTKEIPGILSSTGPLAAADYDGDGDIDLFVGGNFEPPRYPENASSRLFFNEKGNFVEDQINNRKLEDLGLVTGAVFSDYDRDGDPDLILSREWDSLVLLENRDGNFTDISKSVGLTKFQGWWNGITTGDFNNDGRPDLVATNIGNNSIYQLDSSNPLKLYYQDFNMDGVVDMVDAYFDTGENRYVPRKKMYDFDSLPYIQRNVATHQAYGQSTLSEIFGVNFDQVPAKQINTLEHMVFLNTEEGFEPVALPARAQLSTVFHAAVMDYDSDGYEDLFLSQNYFHYPPSTPRQDAGRGLLLKGNGNGTFETIEGQDSGLKVYGDQRGAAVADMNQDRRPDLAVSQNADSTRLFLNRESRQGIRVRLVGSSTNRDAIGSSIRVIYEDGSRGPVREIRAGEGYRSQHSVVQVLGHSSNVRALQVRWFDGTADEIEIDDITKEQVIRY